jgi:hypothetical protein
LVLSAAVLAAGAVMLPFAAIAGDDKRGDERRDDKRLVLTERLQVTGFVQATGAGTLAGTFVAAGAVNEAGTVAATFTLLPGKRGCGTLTGTHVLTGAAGTLSVRTDARACPYPPGTPPRSFVRGKWRVVSGTGAYAGLEGKGVIIATADFATGVITIARDGKVKR